MSVETAPLQPLRFWLESTCIRATPNYEPPQSVVHVPNVQLDIRIGEGTLKDDAPAYECRISLAVVPQTAQQPIPYDIEISVGALYTFVHQASHDRDEMRRIVAISGVTMLYGFARDAVMQHTGLGLNGPFILPALDLRDVPTALASQQGRVRAAEGAEPAGSPAPRRRGRKAQKSAD